MRRARITVTLNSECVSNLDGFIQDGHATNRSQAIEKIVNNQFSSRIDQAVILAGGRGTKLRPYTYEVPKSLLPIQGRPLIERLLIQLKSAQIEQVVICTGYLGEKIEEALGDGSRFGLKIHYSREQSPLQTGGALRLARPLLKDRSFLLMHGDIVTDVPLLELIDFHREKKPTVTVALTTATDIAEYGQLLLRGTQLVKFYQGAKKAKTSTHLINTGIYALDRSIWDYLPHSTDGFLLEDVIERLVAEHRAQGYVFDSLWFDVGTPAHYEAAIRAFGRKKD